MAIGVVVAAGLALQTALGPAMYAIVEAVKATGRIPDGWGGVASILIGIVLGLITGLIAWHQDGDFWWLAVGAFAGLLLGVGGGKRASNPDRHHRLTQQEDDRDGI
jgi:hypothetical protein